MRMRLDSVGKRYGLRQPWVVRDVSADLLQGRLIRLEGRNGSGKSTLLRVAAGVALPSKGRVTGRPHTGYVPERFPGALPFPARDYLLHMARVHGLRGASAARRVDEWLERLGAASYAGQPLRALSKGMCQKVAIAQALVSRPGLLVLDEAWTGLDWAARGALDVAATERAADGGIVMFVDHEQARLAGRISERWQLDGSGQVTVVPGDTAGADSTQGWDDDVVVIELDGLGPGGAAVESQPGVLSCTGAPRATVRVTAAASDHVLRLALSWEGVHVASVRTERGTGAEPGGRPDAGPGAGGRPDAEPGAGSDAGSDAEEAGW
jgi:ABC-type Mn2+/Zn2+ transport system ATPase subunit